MPMYKCQVLDELGQKHTVFRNAGDEISLRGTLKREKLHLTEFELMQEKKKNEFLAVSSKVNPNEVINFLRQFAVMVKAGIPISNCIKGLRTQKYSTIFQNVLMSIHLDIESGILLSDAFKKHPKVFPQYFVNMVAIGEASGSLDTVLSSMADYYENDRRIKKKATSAMVYPMILLALVVVVSLFVTLYVIPQFENTIKGLGGELPKITVIILNISRFVQDYIFLIIPIALLILCSVMIFFKTEAGKYVRDYLLFNFPIIKDVERNLITARFAKAYIILLGSGMNMIDCLENLKKMLGNALFTKKFNYTIEEVKRGRRIASSLAATRLFPTMLTEMISVGEDSGNIEEVLESTSSYFDECVESSISKAVASLEPIMIVLLGLIVGVVIVSVLLPMMSMMNSI